MATIRIGPGITLTTAAPASRMPRRARRRVSPVRVTKEPARRAGSVADGVDAAVRTRVGRQADAQWVLGALRSQPVSRAEAAARLVPDGAMSLREFVGVMAPGEQDWAEIVRVLWESGRLPLCRIVEELRGDLGSSTAELYGVLARLGLPMVERAALVDPRAGPRLQWR